MGCGWHRGLFRFDPDVGYTMERRQLAVVWTDRKEIAIVIGTPPSQIPKTADFSNA